MHAIYNPGTCEFFREWKFLQDTCYFWCRLSAIFCWLTHSLLLPSAVCDSYQGLAR